MQEQIIKRNAPNWKLGLSYFGYTLIGIIPLNVFINILTLYGNYNYKLVIFAIYIIVLPFWVKRTVITASALFLRRYYVTNKNLVSLYTVIYFLIIWLILILRTNLEIPAIIIPSALEIYLLSWVTWYSLKYFNKNSIKNKNGETGT